MMKKLFALILSVLLIPMTVYAADGTDDDLFGSDEEDFLSVPQKKAQPESRAATLSEFLMQNITAATATPINKAEKVFCYVVDYAEKGYEGYTVDGFAIKGYCGELSAEGKSLIKETLFNSTSLYSKSKADCRVSPKIMLRYVFGIDYTDVLLSYPCASLTFFHGNSIAILNANPGEVVLEKIVTAYSSLSEDFQSPALLGQMVGSGVAQNQAQKEIIKRNAPTEAPLKKWSNEPITETSSSDSTVSAPKPASGWNKLK